MKLDQLEAFAAVVRLGSFTAAADALFLAQPSLSRQIAALEHDLGAALFTRGRHGAALTTAGDALLPIARRMLADARAARHEMDELAGLRRGRVRLGAPPTLCGSVVADVLADFHTAHPGVELRVVEAGSRALVEALAEGALDLALTITRTGVPVDPAVVTEPLFTERLVVASAATAPTLGAAVTLARLAELPAVVFDRSYDLRAATDAAFVTAGLTQRIAVAGGEMDAVLRFVERGIGVAVVPATVMHERAGLRATPLVAPELFRTAVLSRRADVLPSAAVAEMERTIRATVGRLAAPGSALAAAVIPASAPPSPGGIPRSG